MAMVSQSTSVTSATNEKNWLEEEKKYYQPTFIRQPITIMSGKGAYVKDDKGKEYLDLCAGIAVNILGHCHPDVVQAVQKQVGELIHVSNLYVHPRQVELAHMLADRSQGMHVFFSNSGAEANEGAIKLARKYGKTHRNGAIGIISMDRSFHGRTLATTAATGQPKYQATWAPLPDGFTQVPFNDFEAVKKATNANTAAVFLEAVQGEGGIYPAGVEYMQRLRQWCDDNDLLLICDEVQSGMGRTGTFFSFEQMGVWPDIVTMAKGLGGGIPIAAMLANDRANIFEPGEHGTTFGGNPVACAAAIATLNALEREHILDHVKEAGTYLLKQLEALKEKHHQILAVRVTGLMAAIDLEGDLATKVLNMALQKGVLLAFAGSTTIRIIPPLILTNKDIDYGIDVLDKTLSELQ